MIDDYAETSGKRRPVPGTNPSLEAGGDPARAATTLIRLVDLVDPPAFFCMGSDAVAAVTGVLRGRLEQVTQHQELSTSSDAD